jgi:hypothetical protein
MQTKKSLNIYSKGQFQSDSFGPQLSRVADYYLKAAEQRKLAEELRSEQAQMDPAHVLALQKKIAELKQQSVLDSDLPAISLFDAYNLMRMASESKNDPGIKACVAHLEKLVKKDPVGSLSIKQAADLKSHYTRTYPSSGVEQAITVTFSRAGYNTLPVTKLATIAAQISSQEDYDAMCEEHGFSGSRPEQIRARSFIRELVNMKNAQKDEDFEPEVNEQQESQERIDVEEGGDVLTQKQARFVPGSTVQVYLGKPGSPGQWFMEPADAVIVSGSGSKFKVKLVHDGPVDDYRAGDVLDATEEGGQLLVMKAGRVFQTAIGKIEAMLLQGEVLESADNLIRINPDTDNVELWIGARNNGGLETSLSNMGKAIHDFLVHSGYKKISKDVYEVSVAPKGQQDDYVSVDKTLGEDSETQNNPAVDEGVAKTDKQVPSENHRDLEFSDGNMGQDSEGQDLLSAPSQSPTLHSNVPEQQPGVNLPADKELGPDSDNKETPELEPSEPIQTSRKGPTAAINDSYFIGKKSASQEYMENLRERRPSRDLLRDIADEDRWLARQASDTILPQKEKRTSSIKQVQYQDRRSEVRNAVRGKIISKRSDLHQFGEGVVGGGDVLHYTFSFDVEAGIPTKDQIQWFVDENSVATRYKVVATSLSGPGMVNVSLKELDRRELARLGQAKADEPAGMGSDYKDVAVSEPAELEPVTSAAGDEFEVGDQVYISHNSTGTMWSEQPFRIVKKIPDSTGREEWRYVTEYGPDAMPAALLKKVSKRQSFEQFPSTDKDIREQLRVWQNKGEEVTMEDLKGLAEYLNVPEQSVLNLAEGFGFPTQKSGRHASPRIREEWNGDKFNRELEAESAEELHRLHRALSGEEVEWPQQQKMEEEGADEKAKEYMESYYGPYGKKLTEGDVTDSEPWSEIPEEEKEADFGSGSGKVKDVVVTKDVPTNNMRQG